jgi:hypothetical protein
MSEADKEQRNHDKMMIEILENLDKIEKNFFIPTKAHPLRKVHSNDNSINNLDEDSYITTSD